MRYYAIFRKHWRCSLRSSYYKARVSGEEFVVILPETSFTKAEELAERLRKHIADHIFPVEDDVNIKLTISVGISSFPEHGQSCQDLLEVADSAMYDTKKAGRNQVKMP